MRFNEKIGHMDWRDEYSWILISISCGVLPSLLYIRYQRFSDVSNLIVVSVCCIAFYCLSILLRIQNHRGRIISGKLAFEEKKLKLFFLYWALRLVLRFSYTRNFCK